MANLTRAKARVLCKAALAPVMIAGGFGGDVPKNIVQQPRFDRAKHIDYLVNEGLLKAGEYANQYVLTLKGYEAVVKLPESKKWSG